MNSLNGLKMLPFELAYLVLLTRSKLKPLSRWEACLKPRQLDMLSDLGLEVALVQRYTILGRSVPRVIFSTSGRYIDEYLRRFDGKRLKHSPAVIKQEGWFFGYPSCCVDQFVKEPYIPNGLAGEDQRILFHWACPDCRSTRSILREYRLIFLECTGIFGGASMAELPSRGFPGRPRRDNALLRRALPWAASLAALSLLPGLAAAQDEDPHRLAAPDDADYDGLSYAEELILGRDHRNADSDGNGVLDGVDESIVFYSIIAGLPREPMAEDPYVIEFPVYGVQQCTVCGEWVNMGYITVVNPLRDLRVDIPYIALHYMEHGSIGYDGSIDKGRVDINLLKRILLPYDPSHIMAPSIADSDSDLLDDSEEPLLSTDPADPDTDQDSVEDGFQIAEDLVAAVSSLPREPRTDAPYLVEHPLRGNETCSMCGATMDMGSVEIVNPLEGISMEVPYIALHYLGHGSLGYSGDIHQSGRTLPTVLRTILSGDGGSHRMPVEGDRDNDGLTDEEELGLGLDPDIPDCDGDLVPDGPDLAVFLHEVVMGLPEGPLPDEKYVINTPTYGMYQCLVCGEQINMGGMEIVDPVRGISTPLSYYNDHFMEHGSFSTDRPDIYGRKDPRDLVDVLEVDITGTGDTPSASVLSNVPNPFTSSTDIEFNLPGQQEVTLTVFDAAGRRVRRVFSGKASGGLNTFIWDGKDSAGRTLPSGVYFCKLKTDSFSLTRKMLKLR